MKLNNPFRKNNSFLGFTLVQVLIYTASFSVLIMVIISFIMWSTRSSAKAKAMQETIDSAQQIMQILTFEIRGAKSVYIPTTNANQISLETKRYLPQGEEISFVDFFLCGQALCMKKESQGPAILTSDSVEIENLSFSVLDASPSLIEIDIRVSYKNVGQRIDYQATLDLHSAVSLRAYQN